MPHRRKNETGSFKDHFDGLVGKFPHEQSQLSERPKKEDRRKDNRHINDLLFEQSARDSSA